MKRFTVLLTFLVLLASTILTTVNAAPLATAQSGSPVLTTHVYKSISGRYYAQPGDTANKLAVKFHTTPALIMKYNPWILGPNQNLGGNWVLLPSA